MGLPTLNAPNYTIKVPSSGKVIKYRPYLVKEEKILMMAMESKSEVDMIEAIKDVIISCTNGALTDKDLTMFDIEYLFLQLRAKSVGEIAKVVLPCQKCDHNQNVKIDLTKVEVDGLPKNSKGYIRKINDEVKVKLRYPSINRAIKTLRDNENEKISDTELSYKVVLQSIEEIYFGDEVYSADEQTEEDLINFIESMTGPQFAEIRAFVDQVPMAAIDYDFHCTKCKSENKYHLRGLASFFG